MTQGAFVPDTRLPDFFFGTIYFGLDANEFNICGSEEPHEPQPSSAEARYRSPRRLRLAIKSLKQTVNFFIRFNMDILELREACLSMPGAEESTPFNDTVLVYKVGGKMFALFDMESPGWVNLKCEPEVSEELRERYPADITPGIHMNKRHWNTLRTDGDLPSEFILSMIRRSWRLVVAGLPRAARAGFAEAAAAIGLQLSE